MDKIQEIFDILTKEIERPCEEEDEDMMGPIDAKELWEFLFEVAGKHLTSFSAIFTTVGSYMERFKELRNNLPEKLVSEIAAVMDESVPYETRMESVKPLLYLTPFMNVENAGKIITCCVDIMTSAMTEKNDLPESFLDCFADCILGSGSEEVVQAVLELLKKTMETEKKVAALLIFGRLVEDEDVEVPEELGDFIQDAIHSVLEDDDASDVDKIGACYALDCAKEAISIGQDEVFEMMKPLMTSDNTKLSMGAYHAFREMLWDEFFSDSILEMLIESFSEFPPSMYKQYFKMLELFMGDGCDDSCCEEEDEECSHHTSAVIIMEFVAKLIKENTSAAVQGFCLNLAGAAAAIDGDLISEVYTEMLGIAKGLIAGGNVDTYRYVGNFLFAVAKCFLEETQGTIAELIPDLIKFFDNAEDESQLKNKLHLAGDLASICGECGIQCEGAHKVLKEFALEIFESEDIPNAMRACPVIIGLKAFLDDEYANTVYKHFMNMFVTVGRDEDKLELMKVTMKKLLKRYNIPYAASNPFTKGFLDGTLNCLEGLQAWNHAAPVDEIFDFMCVLIKKYGQETLDHVLKILEWPKHALRWSLPAIFECVHTAIIEKIAGKEHYGMIAQTALVHIKMATIDDVDLITSCTNILAAVYKADKSVVTPAEDYIQPFGRLIDDLVTAEKEAEEEEDDMEDVMESAEIVPAITRFALDVYSTDEAVHINEEMFIKLFNFMPFEEEEGMVAVIEALNEVIETERFAFVKPNVAALYTVILLFKLEEFEIQEDTLKSMKNVLKNAITKDPRIKAAVREACGQGKKVRANTAKLAKLLGLSPREL